MRLLLAIFLLFYSILWSYDCSSDELFKDIKEESDKKEFERAKEELGIK